MLINYIVYSKNKIMYKYFEIVREKYFSWYMVDEKKIL